MKSFDKQVTDDPLNSSHRWANFFAPCVLPEFLNGKSSRRIQSVFRQDDA